MSDFSTTFMDQALKEAENAAIKNEVPVAAIIVHKKSQKIISIASNKIEAKCNPLMHAEIIAINMAIKELNIKYLNDYDLYVTLEPCVMCASAISHARIGRLFFAASDPKFGAVINGIRLYSNNYCNHKPEIYPDIMRDKSEALLNKFFSKLRK